jgi:Co/Zn/Cd efflux system component
MILDSVPKDLDFEEVKNNLLKISGVLEINDLHILQTGSKNRILSAHLKIDELDARKRIELISNIQITV